MSSFDWANAAIDNGADANPEDDRGVARPQLRECVGGVACAPRSSLRTKSAPNTDPPGWRRDQLPRARFGVEASAGDCLMGPVSGWPDTAL